MSTVSIEAVSVRRVGDWPARALALGWAAALLVLLWTSWADRGVPIDTWAFGNFSLGLVLGAAGLLVTGRLPRNPIGWYFLAGGVGQALCGATRGMAVHLGTTDPAALEVARWCALVSGIAQTVGLFTLPMVLLHFPDGSLRSRRWRPARWLVIGAFAANLFLSAFVAGPFTPELPHVTNPLGQAWIPDEVLWDVTNVLTMLAIVVAAAALLVRLRGAAADERRALRWVTITGVVLAAEVCVEMTPLSDGSQVFAYLGPAVLALFVASIGVAVLRHHLWDLDVIVNVSLVYTILTVVAALVFLGAVEGTARLVDHTSPLWPAVAAGGVLLVVIAPLRRIVQGFVDRLVYGTSRDPRGELGRRTRSVTGGGSTHERLRQVVDAVAETYPRLDHVAIRTPRNSVVTGSSPRTDVVRFPLRFHGLPTGTLEVAGPPGAPVTGQLRVAMAEVVDDLAAVVHAIEVSGAVEEVRRELATTREEERRRLRRDIHDGVGPALAAIALRIEGATTLVDRDPAQAKQVLTGLGPEVRGVLDDVRRLVYDLRPPELDALGLVGAVRDRALRFGGGAGEGQPDTRVEVDATTDLGEVSAAAEVAAYRIVGEALSNATRHAGAHSVRVRLAVEGHDLVVCVDDDGQGLGRAGAYGVGTVSMIERATALGGSCELTGSPLGGVRVRAVLPLHRATTGGGGPDGR